MNQFILPKDIDYSIFKKYLSKASKNNQFTNYGHAVQTLEKRAREMLKINDDKAVIAVTNGSSAVSTIIYSLEKERGSSLRTLTQDFTFPSNAQLAASGAFVTDFDEDLNIDLNYQWIDNVDIVVVTNIFGHLQNLDKIMALSKDKILVLDNAATPYSFYKGTNSCNLGFASYISLHHTKPIGFGEGGLVIIDKDYEESARAIISFGWIGGKFNERGSNFKMSEISAAAILQWWDRFNIDELKEKYLHNYYNKRYEMATEHGQVYPHRGDMDFFPSCLPYIHNEFCNPKNNYEFKYYKPLIGLPISQDTYNKIICYGIAENWYV